MTNQLYPRATELKCDMIIHITYKNSCYFSNSLELMISYVMAKILECLVRAEELVKFTNGQGYVYCFSLHTVRTYWTCSSQYKPFWYRGPISSKHFNVGLRGASVDFGPCSRSTYFFMIKHLFNHKISTRIRRH